MKVIFSRDVIIPSASGGLDHVPAGTSVEISDEEALARIAIGDCVEDVSAETLIKNQTQTPAPIAGAKE